MQKTYRLCRHWSNTLLLAGAGIGSVVLLGWWFTVDYGWVATSVVEESTGSFSATEEIFTPFTIAPVGFAGRYTLAELAAWERSAGPPRVGLQVGHLDNSLTDLPAELSGLANNGAGAVWGPYTERQVNQDIVQLTAARLEAVGIQVDILPAVIPPGYEADAFVSIHADGNTNETARGFKIAGPRRDYSTYAELLAADLYTTYQAATGLPIDTTITGRMSAYYAFNWTRFEHAVHPRTPAVIVETGFLTNASDRAVIITAADQAAAGIAEGILVFLERERESWQPPAFARVPDFPLVGTLECAPLRPTTRVRNSETCVPSIRVTDDTGYVLMGLELDEELMTTETPITITSANYTPLPALDTFLWYRYQVAGELAVIPSAVQY